MASALRSHSFPPRPLRSVTIATPPSRPLPGIVGTLGALADPETPEEWEMHIGALLMTRPDVGFGAGKWTPGATLKAIERDHAIVQPAGHGGKTERVPIKSIKLWDKGNHQRNEIEAARRMKRGEEVGTDTRVKQEKPAAAVDTSHFIVIRHGETGKYWGLKDGKQGFSCSLTEANSWKNRNAPMVKMSCERKKGSVSKAWNLSYLTERQAHELEARLRANHVISETKPQAVVAVVVEPIPAPATKQPEPVAAAVIAPPAPVSVPVPAPATPPLTDTTAHQRRKAVFEQWAAALKEEASAQAMLLECQGKRAVADCAMKIEQHRKEMGFE